MTENPEHPESFHAYLDARSTPLWDAIFDLPFVREVAAGTLERERFAYFIREDLLYLDEFARVLATGARMAEKPETRQMFLAHAANVNVVEQALHATVGERLGLDPELIRQREPAPVTMAYTDHLMKVAASGTLIELVGAVLPCYWVYQRVGERLAANMPGDELYATWIASYASPEFEHAVSEQLGLIDELANAAGEAQRDRAERWFTRSLRYEWMFWDQAHRRLEWPLGTNRL